MSNQISQYDSKSCKLLVHGINKTVTVKRANEQTRAKKSSGTNQTVFGINAMSTTTPLSENSKKTSDSNNQNKTIRTSKTVDDALNKLLKLTENLIHVVPRTHANVSHMITREILLFYHHSVFAHSLLFCSGCVCV